MSHPYDIIGLAGKVLGGGVNMGLGRGGVPFLFSRFWLCVVGGGGLWWGRSCLQSPLWVVAIVRI